MPVDIGSYDANERHNDMLGSVYLSDVITRFLRPVVNPTRDMMLCVRDCGRQTDSPDGVCRDCFWEPIAND